MPAEYEEELRAAFVEVGLKLDEALAQLDGRGPLLGQVARKGHHWFSYYIHSFLEIVAAGRTG